MSVPQALNLAIEHHQAGRFAEAEAIYRQVLAQQPNNADALHLLGVLTFQRQNNQLALSLIRQAIAINPLAAMYHNNLGLVLKELGRWELAEESFRTAIRRQPDLAGAHFNLGKVLMSLDRMESAAKAFETVVQLRPNDAVCYNYLGTVLQKLHRDEDAAAAFNHAIRLKPDYAEAHNNLGNTLKEQHRLSEAIDQYHVALKLKPNGADAQNNLGNALKDQGKLDDALTAYRKALEFKTDDPIIYNNLGIALCAQGQYEAAIVEYNKALKLKPDDASTHYHLGNALIARGQTDAAVAAFHHALDIKPDLVEAQINLGSALLAGGETDAAITAYQTALKLKPYYPVVYNNLGNALKDQGKLDAALENYRKALELAPQNHRFGSNVIYTLHYHPDFDARAIQQELRRWQQRYAEELKKFIQPHANNRDPERQLKIGYVSADLRDSPIARFLIPLLRNHDRKGFEIFCFNNTPRADVVTENIRSLANVWRDIHSAGDQEVAQMIRNDQIDILIDLTMHMANNRLPIFARKPAPIQVTWLGYPGSTGLDTMDYRLTDPYLDPPGLDDAFYSEESIRLPDSFWCYDPLCDLPPRPAKQNGPICFGSLNNPCKLNDQVFNLWSSILKATPDSRLLMLIYSVEHQNHIRMTFERTGIDPTRLIFVGRLPREPYLRSYNLIDLGLDTLFYNGHTTTFDSLWMGVPIVTLKGRTAVGRGGTSILNNIGLPELVAQTPQEYVDIAVKLAENPTRLAELHRTLRERMENSPLMDAKRFARNVEAAYRNMWRKYCATF